MRKYVIGAIFGALLATAFSAGAEQVQSLIGKEIQGEFDVSVNGKKLDNKAIVRDGTSYAPVRAVGEALGLDVGFDANSGIALKSKAANADQLKAANEKAQKYQALQKQADEIAKQVGGLWNIIKPYEIPDYQPDGTLGVKPSDDIYTQTKSKRDALIAQQEDIQKQLDELRKQ